MYKEMLRSGLAQPVAETAQGDLTAPCNLIKGCKEDELSLCSEVDDERKRSNGHKLYQKMISDKI